MDFFYSNIVWITDVLMVLGIIILCKIIGPLFAYILIKMFNFKEKDKNKIKENAFYKPIKAFILLLGIYLTTKLFYIPDNIKVVIEKVFRICTILIITNGFLNFVSPNSESFKKLKRSLHFNGNNGLVNIASRALKILIYIVSGFIIVSELGYDLGGLVTGLGISSVVIALAAQDLAKSLFGGVCIFLDKPFGIGDYIELDNFEGTIEDITLRTTRIRSINGELIIIPNNQISNAEIKNHTKRILRRYTSSLVLELSTPLEKVSDFKKALVILLNNNEHILKENMRVFFDTISDNGINVEISCYTDIIDYNDFLAFKENLNFEILNLLQIKNIELAYDSKTIYLKKD